MGIFFGEHTGNHPYGASKDLARKLKSKGARS